MYVTTSTKLWAFQYRLLNKILTTNVTRSKLDKSISPLCQFCSIEAETTLHLLYFCIKVKLIWEALVKWIQYFFDINVELTPDIIILNNYNSQLKQLINMYIVVTKQFIYAEKCLKEQLRFAELVERFNYWCNKEKLAITNSKPYSKFKRKWEIHEKKL